MERMIEIIEDLRIEAEEARVNDYTAHAFAVVGNKDDYKVEFVGDPRDLEETIYFICSRDKQMLEVFREAVRIASDLESKEETKEE